MITKQKTINSGQEIPDAVPAAGVCCSLRIDKMGENR
jgi:hypothetical protein